MSQTVPKRVSLRKSLPLLICGLLLLVIAGYSWAAYQSVRRTVIEAARARLGVVTDQIVASLEISGRQLRPLLIAAADRPAYRAYLRSRTPANETAALKELRVPGPNHQQVTSVELWDTRRQRLVSTEVRRPGSGIILDADEWPADSSGVGRFHEVNDSLVYATIAPVRSDSTTLGFLVQWRAVQSSPQTQQIYSKLIGADAGLYIGNDRGDIWTDLSKPVPAPPFDMKGATGLIEYERPGKGEWMAYLRHLRGMPWVVMVDFSSDTILSTVWAFERRVALVATIILVLGFLIAWLLSRGITGPIEQLTTAAETVATGRETVPVPATRHAELARLADAFNGMAARVHESQHVLEDRVAARTHELQERNEELEAFGYSISHDLRAPLRAMQGFSQILLDEYGDRLDDEGRRYAGRIVAGATRMDQLIRDLLAYSRISREQLEPVPVNLSRIVKTALEQIDAELAERGADVKVQEPLPAVVGHAATLSQVVANLLGNGAKFMPPGRVPHLNVRAEPGREVVRLWVEDNGIGIQPEHQERIFGVFERLHANDEYPGTGIGLAIVRKGIERMGGRVGVESTPGQGSRFWIELPTVSAA